MNLVFDFLHVEDVDSTGPSSPLPTQLISLGGANSQSALRVEYEALSGLVRATFGDHLTSEAVLPLSGDGDDDWTRVEVSVKPATLEMDLLLYRPDGSGDVSIGVLKKRAMGPIIPPSLDDASEGITVGPSNSDQKTLTCLSIDEPAEQPLKRSRRRASDEDYTYHRGTNVSALNFEGSNGYVRYDFRNRIRIARPDGDTGKEEVALDFVLKRGVTSGLLWFAEGPASKSYIIIKVSGLLTVSLVKIAQLCRDERNYNVASCQSF